MNDYLADFERLANRIVGLPASFLLSYFISGLIPEIRHELQALQPITLPQVVALAKLQEAFTKAKCPNHSHFPHPQNPIPALPLSSIPPLLPSPTPTLLPTPRKPSLKRLTPTKLATRRDKGLCYNCDERWNRKNKCKSRFLLLVADEDISPDHVPNTIPSLDNPNSNNLADAPDPFLAHISLHALSGHTTPETFRVLGSIHGHEVVVLIDDVVLTILSKHMWFVFLALLPTTLHP